MIKLPQSNAVNNRIDKVTKNLCKCYYKWGQLCIIAKWLRCHSFHQFWYFTMKFHYTL